MPTNFSEFLDYVESFYLPSHPDVLYPIENLTREEIALATLNYLDACDGEVITWGSLEVPLHYLLTIRAKKTMTLKSVLV